MLKYTVILATIVIFVVAFIYALMPGASVSQDRGAAGTIPTAGMRAENNMVIVLEQKPGPTVTGAIIVLAAPGFLVIHEDVNGEPGPIIGASGLLPAGESNTVAVSLSRPTRDGEKLHAMLHSDTDANGTFSTADIPVQSALGGPIEGWFDISADAQDAGPIAI